MQILQTGDFSKGSKVSVWWVRKAVLHRPQKSKPAVSLRKHRKESQQAPMNMINNSTLKDYIFKVMCEV